RDPLGEEHERDLRGERPPGPARERDAERERDPQGDHRGRGERPSLRSQAGLGRDPRRGQAEGTPHHGPQDGPAAPGTAGARLR
ncbi:hypothetical protein NDU88_011676, partial [Pleurodeles waltl]